MQKTNLPLLLCKHSSQSAVTCLDVSQKASISLDTFSHMMHGKHIAIGNKRIEKTRHTN